MRRLIVISVVTVYTGLVCFSFGLHNHSIGIDETTNHSFSTSNLDKDIPVINNVRVISQRQSVSCFACAFENNNKASKLQVFSQAWSNHSSTTCLSFQTILPQSFLLESFQVRAPPTATS